MAGVENTGEGDGPEHFYKVMDVDYETSKETCFKSNKSW